jgi:photosystem II stability/assembly factor-like uncharacterized protein
MLSLLATGERSGLLKLRNVKLVIILASILSGPFLYCQWTRPVAPQIGVAPSRGGAACYSDGVAWVGEESLFMSLDSGITWVDRTPIPRRRMSDLFFLDKMNGIMVPLSQSRTILLTSDQGISWRQVTFTNNAEILMAAAFIDSPKDIIIVAEKGNIFHSHDGGNSWMQTRLEAQAFDIVPVGNGVAYVSSGRDRNTGASLYFTRDFGRTWQKTAGVFDLDSYQFVQDQCDPNIFYVANEDATSSKDGLSCIFTSTDNGNSWSQSDQHPITYHCGSISSSKNAIFAQTANGVFRSTDKGKTWQDIGGPEHFGIDNRLVCAISNNIILAVDTLARIYRTGNSGGYPMPEANTEDLTWFPATAFEGDSLYFCDSMGFDSMRLDTIIICPTCSKITVTETKLTGNDTADYIILSYSPGKVSACDTLILGFRPSHLGISDASFSISLENGQTYSIPFHGKGVAPEPQISFIPTTLYAGDTVSLCDTNLTRVLYISSVMPCGPMKIVRAAVEGFYASEYDISPVPLFLSSYDSIKVVFTPQGGGLRVAQVVLELEGGIFLTIPLSGVGTVPKAAIQFSQPELFVKDTLCLSDALSTTIELSINYCRPLKVIGQTLQGSNKADYTIKRALPDAIDTDGVLEIEFKPTGQGFRDAELIISFDDGSIYRVQLQGNSIPTVNLSLVVGNSYNDTLGGLVKIPFSFKGLPYYEDVAFSVTYDNALEFVGVLSPQNLSIGKEIHSANWARVTIPAGDVILNAPTGYILFRVFSDSGAAHAVNFDSLSISSSRTRCLNIGRGTIATVTSLAGCEAEILSRFLRTGKIASFVITPNPAHSELNLIPSLSIKNATVEILNILGEELYSASTDFAARTKNAINISNFAEGMYYIRIHTSDNVFQSLFAVKR